VKIAPPNRREGDDYQQALAEYGVQSTSGRRLALARWITDAANPLTARVIVNRVWQYHFGRGLVATPEDFGNQGVPPTHPELLDWLATELVKEGWSLKKIHRLMVTSATYRQSPQVTPALARPAWLMA